MYNGLVNVLDLGPFSDEEKSFLRKGLTYKKKISKMMKEARQLAKRNTCYYCNKPVESFCKSHSVPQFCLRNIASNGDVLTLNAVIDNPIIDIEKGIGEAGTFRLICRECDSTIFSDYENPDNYNTIPTSKMIAQMALKNNLKLISKRLIEIEFYNILSTILKNGQVVANEKNYINKLDLNAYIDSYIKARRSIEKNNRTDYYICYYEKLDYVVPIAFQGSLCLAYDFDGNVINDIYNTSPEYDAKNIHLSILPLKNESVIVMFIDNGDKRYRRFYKQFSKLSLEDKLAALTFIIFAYSEDMYFSKTIYDETVNNQALCNVGRTGQDVLSSTPFFDSMEVIRDSYDLNKMHDIPNLLSEKYKLNKTQVKKFIKTQLYACIKINLYLIICK